MIDALSGHHLWSERYDRDLKDIFAMQDEVTLKILTAMQVKLTEGEQASTILKSGKGKQDLDLYLKSWEAVHHLRRASIEDNNTARRIVEEIIAKSPEDPYGYIFLGWVHVNDMFLGSSKSPQESLEKAMKQVQKALVKGDSIPGAHGMLSMIYSLRKEHGKAIAEGERALALDPNGADAHESYARSLLYAGRSKEAIPVFQKAIRLNPIGSTDAFNNLGTAYSRTGRFEEAVSAYKQALVRNPGYLFAHLGLASAYIAMGREKEARVEAAEVLRINPKFSLDNFAKVIAGINPNQSESDRYFDRLRKAGLK